MSKKTRSVLLVILFILFITLLFFFSASPTFFPQLNPPLCFILYLLILIFLLSQIELLIPKEIDFPTPFRYERNPSADHAREIIRNFIDLSKKTIKIRCEKFSHIIWGHDIVEQAISSALDRGVSIEAIIEKDVDNESQKIFSLIKESKIKLFKTELKGKQLHFLLVDGVHLRIEKKTIFSLFSRDPRSAYCRRFAWELGEKYLTYFEELKKISSSLN